MILSIGSALHGGDRFGRWEIAPVTMVLYALIGFGVGGVDGAVYGFVATLLYWLTMRTSLQADTENDRMDTLNDKDVSFRKCVEAYLPPTFTYMLMIAAMRYFHDTPLWPMLLLIPSAFFGAIATTIFNYSSKFGQWAGWEKKWIEDDAAHFAKTGQRLYKRDANGEIIFPFHDCRRIIEYIVGKAGDINVWIIIMVGCWI